MYNPLISIIIPVYNGANYLQEAINSALSQTYSNFEVIIVNDGSCDNGATEQICLSYGKKIRYFRKENGGVATALNLGIEHMHGEYFSWLSHDDLYYPDKLSCQIDALKQCGEMNRVVFGDYDILHEINGNISHIKLDGKYPLELLECAEFPVIYNLVNGCVSLVPKNCFARIGLFNPELRCVQDYDMWLDIFAAAKSLYIPRALSVTRVHNKMGTLTNTVQMNREEIKLFYKMSLRVSESTLLNSCVNTDYIHLELYSRLKSLKANDPAESVLRKISAAQLVKPVLPGKVCIFGAGVYGIRLYYYLRVLGICVYYFADNDSNKRSRIIVNDVRCLSFDELVAIKDEVFVIVAAIDNFSMLEQLRNAEFPQIVTKQELDMRLLKVAI